MITATTKPCPRCDADRPGTVTRHLNVLGGRCFRCGGSGVVAHNDGRFVHMTVRPGIITARVDRDGRPGVVDNDDFGGDETTYTCALSAIGAIDLDTIDDDASIKTRRAIRDAANAAARRAA